MEYRKIHIALVHWFFKVWASCSQDTQRCMRGKLRLSTGQLSKISKLNNQVSYPIKFFATQY